MPVRVMKHRHKQHLDACEACGQQYIGRSRRGEGLPAIENLDLGVIERKLTQDPKLEWDDARACQACQDYRKFLTIIFKYRKQAHVPSRDIDEVWHEHIKDTRTYLRDCHRIFGRFIHHSPIFEMSDGQMKVHAQDRLRTIDLFRQEFGNVPESYEPIYLASGSTNWCCCDHGG